MATQRRSRIDTVEHRAFRVAWKLTELLHEAYIPGFWTKPEREVQKAFNLSNLPVASTPGAQCTTGGIALYVGSGVPLWIETPWGEWNCFGAIASQWDFVPCYASDEHRLEQVLGEENIDWKNSVPNRRMECAWTSNAQIALNAFQGYKLRARIRQPATHARPLREWIALCMYYRTIVPHDYGSIHQWLQEATALEQQAFRKAA